MLESIGKKSRRYQLRQEVQLSRRMEQGLPQDQSELWPQKPGMGSAGIRLIDTCLSPSISPSWLCLQTKAIADELGDRA